MADEQGMEGVGGWENLQTALLKGRGVGEKKRGCWPGGTGRLINFSGLETRFQTFSDFYLLLDPRRNRNERNGTIVNLFRSCGRKFIERNTNTEGITFSNHFISIIFISSSVFPILKKKKKESLKIHDIRKMGGGEKENRTSSNYYTARVRLEGSPHLPIHFDQPSFLSWRGGGDGRRNTYWAR